MNFTVYTVQLCNSSAYKTFKLEIVFKFYPRFQKKKMNRNSKVQIQKENDIF